MDPAAWEAAPLPTPRLRTRPTAKREWSWPPAGHLRAAAASGGRLESLVAPVAAVWVRARGAETGLVDRQAVASGREATGWAGEAPAAAQPAELEPAELVPVGWVRGDREPEE